MEVIILTIGILSIAISSIIVLSIVIYNQMLMVNEINKRLLLIAKESQEKERLTMAELESWIRSSGNVDAPVEKPTSEKEEEFDPFSFQNQQAEPKDETDL
jgi:hypothetical protein